MCERRESRTSRVSTVGLGVTDRILGFLGRPAGVKDVYGNKHGLRMLGSRKVCEQRLPGTEKGKWGGDKQGMDSEGTEGFEFLHLGTRQGSVQALWNLHTAHSELHGNIRSNCNLKK